MGPLWTVEAAWSLSRDQGNLLQGEEQGSLPAENSPQDLLFLRGI